MPLELRKGTRRWYWRIGKARTCVTLEVPFPGTPPPSWSLKHKGDAEFEAGRAIAQAKLDSLAETVTKQEDREAELRRMHEIRQGEKWPEVRLDAMFDAYAAIPRSKLSWKRSRYATQLKVLFERFAKFCAQHQKRAILMSAVTAKHALDFMKTVEAST